MLCHLSNSEAGGVREDRWLQREGSGGRWETFKTQDEVLIWGVPERLDTELALCLFAHSLSQAVCFFWGFFFSISQMTRPSLKHKAAAKCQSRNFPLSLYYAGM